MSKIKVSSVTKGQPPCPGPAPKPIPMPRPAPTDAPRPFPPPPPFFMPGPCCPSSTQVVDNITVQSLDQEKIEVVEGSYLGMKAFGIDAKTFEGIGTTGMVPPPQEGDEDKVLTSNGEWSDFIIEIPQSDWAQEDDTQVDYIKNKPELAKVATTGSYNDLTDKPVILQSDWAQTDSGKEDYIKNKPGEYAGSAAGLVPHGTLGDQEKFLRGDGQWADVDNTSECTANDMDAWIREVENG